MFDWEIYGFSNCNTTFIRDKNSNKEWIAFLHWLFDRLSVWRRSPRPHLPSKYSSLGRSVSSLLLLVHHFSNLLNDFQFLILVFLHFRIQTGSGTGFQMMLALWLADQSSWSWKLSWEDSSARFGGGKTFICSVISEIFFSFSTLQCVF